MGSGRSGTSMLGGILHQAGYFMGEKLHKPHESNPKGFFEWYRINKINEDILAGYGQKTLKARLIRKLMKHYVVQDPGLNQRWLFSIPPEVDIAYCNPDIEKAIKSVVSREPFCYKDPRFSYTLPVWKNYLKPGTVFICVFREPNVAVDSILKECRDRDYLESLKIDRRSAFRVWINIYSHILFKHVRSCENFLFVHYNQVYEGSALPLLSDYLEVNLKADFVDKDLKRTVSFRAIPGDAKKIYRQLCLLAHYPIE